MKRTALPVAIAVLSENPEHVAAIAQLNDRLRPMRCAERSVLGPEDEELAGLEQAFDDRARLRTLIVDYHRRRLKFTAQIVERLYRR